MARNDPTDTGCLFIGRRPGRRRCGCGRGRTASPPVRGGASTACSPGSSSCVRSCSARRCGGPSPRAAWVGSMVNYWTGSVGAGILSAFIVIMISLLLTLVVLRRLDHVWMLVRWPPTTIRSGERSSRSS
ncbi:MAG: hypothetical protein H0T96_08900 [Thermoleophilaceae bacterium]|nr:hypothetical protein [Thermoleophilaceae bacterium]